MKFPNNDRYFIPSFPGNIKNKTVALRVRKKEGNHRSLKIKVHLDNNLQQLIE
jgi:hypothetical protein